MNTYQIFRIVILSGPFNAPTQDFMYLNQLDGMLSAGWRIARFKHVTIRLPTAACTTEKADCMMVILERPADS